jgi:hypothetical protein
VDSIHARAAKPRTARTMRIGAFFFMNHLIEKLLTNQKVKVIVEYICMSALSPWTFDP